MQFEDGNLKFSIRDLFLEMLDELSDDDRADFLEDLYLLDEAYANFIYRARDTYTAPHYNSAYFKLFKDFLTMPAEFSWQGNRGIVRALGTAVESLAAEAARYKLENNKLKGSKWGFLHEVRDKFTGAAYRDIRDMYEQYHEVPDALDKARTMTNEFDFRSIVEEWVEYLQDIFAKEEEECIS